MTVKDTVKDTADRATAYASDKLASASDRIHDATDRVRETASDARVSVGDSLGVARDKVADAYDAARDRSGVAYDSARDKAKSAYSSACSTASSARVKAADSVDDNPIAALIGGVALGALIGALLPRSDREAQTLGPIGDKIGTAALAAFAAAKAAGQEKLDELGVNKDAAREQVDKLISNAGQAAATAGTAAVDAVRNPQS